MLDLRTQVIDLPSLTPVTVDAPIATNETKLPSQFADAQRRIMDDALQAGDYDAYRRAKRSLRSHYRFHAMQYRDASRFPISHDDHLASTAHQHAYHARGDVERMSVGLAEVAEWQPMELRKMDASRGVERVEYEVETPSGTITTHDWLALSQRDHIHFDRDRDELASDYALSSLAEAERLNVHIDDLSLGMRAKASNTYAPAE